MAKKATKQEIVETAEQNVQDTAPQQTLNQSKRAEYELKISSQLRAVNDALKTADIHQYALELSKLRRFAELWTKSNELCVFEEIKTAEKPYAEFVKRYSFTTKRVVEVADKLTEQIENVEVQSGERRLNLTSFVKFCEGDYTILETIQQTLELMTIREKNILSLTHDDFVKKSPFFIETVKAKYQGETPDSNRQICKKIQSIMDKMGIECKVINPDMHFVQQCAFVQANNAKCAIKSVGYNRFENIMVDVAFHFLTDTSYTLLEQKQRG